MDHPSLKKSLRKKHKALRKALSPEIRAEHSRAMLRHFQESKLLSGVAHLHLFLSIERFNEPDTFLFLHWLREARPEIRLYVPEVQENSPVLAHIHLKPSTEIRVNDWGIPEPLPPYEKVDPVRMDLVLVPLLAFDPDKNRLGYGKGMYDRFLSSTRSDCKKIGLSYGINAETGGLPAESFDVPLDKILTEKGLH